MARLNSRKIVSLAAAAAVALVAIAYLVRQQPAPVIDDSGPEPLAETVVGPQTGTEDAGDPAEPTVLDPPHFSQSARPLGEAETRRLQQMVAAHEPFPHDVRMDHYKQELWSEIIANPPEIMRPGDPELDGDMAYRLYMYFGNCSIAPRTAHHVDLQLERITNRAQENASARALERLEDSANQLLNFYELCLLIPPEVDPRMEAVTWMGEAVRLGHEVALVQYYEKAMGFILRADRWTDRPPLVMLHAGLIEEFKSTARYALSRAMEYGHPEAYLAMSEALDEGVIYPRDPVLAYAYARVAELQAAKNQIVLTRVGQHKSALAAILDPAQQAEAEELALQLRLGVDG